MYNQQRSYFVYFVAGLTTGTNSNAHLWWRGLAMCTILCVVWRGFGFGLAAPISPSLPPYYILSVRIVGVAYWWDRASNTLSIVVTRGIRVSARDCEKGGGNPNIRSLRDPSCDTAQAFVCERANRGGFLSLGLFRDVGLAFPTGPYVTARGSSFGMR